MNYAKASCWRCGRYTACFWERCPSGCGMYECCACVTCIDEVGADLLERQAAEHLKRCVRIDLVPKELILKETTVVRDAVEMKAVTCSFCGEPGHNRRGCRRPIFRGRPRPRPDP